MILGGVCMNNEYAKIKDIAFMSNAEKEIEFDKTLFELWDHYEPKMAIFQHISDYFFRIDFNPKYQLLKEGRIQAYCDKYLSRIDTKDKLDKKKKTVYGYRNKVWRMIKILIY